MFNTGHSIVHNGHHHTINLSGVQALGTPSTCSLRGIYNTYSRLVAMVNWTLVDCRASLSCIILLSYTNCVPKVSCMLIVCINHV